MRAENVYTAVGANRSSACCTVGSSGLVAFGAGRFVALWLPEAGPSRGIRRTLPGHGAEVTTVKLLSSQQDREELISGDAAGEVRIWEVTRDGEQYQSVSALQAHPSSSISAIGVPPAGDGPLAGHFLTGGSDGSVKVWKRAGGKAELVQTVNPKGKLPLDLALYYLPGGQAPILVIACTDRRIQIWTWRQGQFSYALSLEGHEDWVRSLSITPYPSSSTSSTSDLLLASGSQDNFIRLWRISPSDPPLSNGATAAGADSLDMLDEFEQRLTSESGAVQISTKAHVLALPEGRWSITLEALLVGHEAGLTDVNWSPPTCTSFPTPRLLSTARDNSLVIWQPSDSSGLSTTDGIWVPTHRFGSIGGRGLAFFGAQWGNDGDSVIATGWNGGVERWTRAGVAGQEVWEPSAGLSGHYGDVQSISWDPQGDYLVSVSSDQTSRIHAETSREGSRRWGEIARPQIHGYDMTDAAFLSPLRFISAADEKLLRVFDAPGGFVQSLSSLGVVDTQNSAIDPESRPKGATVPPLGLSNRALGKDLDATDVPTANQAVHSVSRAFSSLPTEEELASTTLWPEVEKVYGHGYELVACAASHDGKVAATACRASSAEHAVVRLTSTDTWDALGAPLSGHTLTITRIAFSPDDSRILTSSRDRGWRVFGHTDDGTFVPLAVEERAHGRMMLDACWLPDGKAFATASRDKTVGYHTSERGKAEAQVKLWSATDEEGKAWVLRGTIKLPEAATAVDALAVEGGLLLAIGTESGGIELHTLSEGLDSTASLQVARGDGHVGAVNRLAFRPSRGGGGRDRKVALASCSDDRSVRVYEIHL